MGVRKPNECKLLNIIYCQKKSEYILDVANAVCLVCFFLSGNLLTKSNKSISV